jgi:tetratricopeptide (TPR) repeat protein
MEKRINARSGFGTKLLALSARSRLLLLGGWLGINLLLCGCDANISTGGPTPTPPTTGPEGSPVTSTTNPTTGTGGTSATDGQELKTGQEYFEAAYQWLAEGDFKAALACLDRAEKLGYSAPKLMLGRATVYTAIGRYDEAFQVLNRLVKEQPTPAVYNALGTLFREETKYQEALAAFDQSLKLDSSAANATTFTRRALVWQLLGQDDKALSDLKQALSLQPQDYLAYYDAGMVAYNDYDWPTAIGYFEQACQRNPASQVSYMQLGLAYSHHNQPDKAIAAFNQAMTLGGNLDPNPLYYRAIAYRNAGQYAEALADLNRLINQFGQRDAQILFDRGVTYRRLGKPQAAIEDLTQAIVAYNAKDAEFYYQRAYAYFDLGNEKAGLSDWQTALKLDPPAPD